MKKIAYAIQLMAVLVSTAALADNDRWGGRSYGWGGGNGWGGYNHGYPGRQMNNYYPQPQANYYSQQSPRYYQSQPQYYVPQPQYNNGGGYYQHRYPQGFAGGGNGLGYQQGNRKALTEGIGTSAGPFIGIDSGRRK
jgi:hypothetical protein